MPWQETTPMRELVRFIGEWEAKVYGFGELCERHGISQKTGTSGWVGTRGGCGRAAGQEPRPAQLPPPDGRGDL